MNGVCSATLSSSSYAIYDCGNNLIEAYGQYVSQRRLGRRCGDLRDRQPFGLAEMPGERDRTSPLDDAVADRRTRRHSD